jgi:pyruvate dehydrogenase E2 component (dihydrolipoamide acetyltransferase)
MPVQDIPMPRLSDSMEEATILAWLKQPGEQFVRGEPLVEVDTDKATIVYEAEDDGTLVEILVGVGETAALGDPIARAAVGAAASAPPVSPPKTNLPAPSTPPAASLAQRPSGGRRARATPVARRLAVELGVPLADLVGTGPGGRIRQVDVARAGDAAGVSAHSARPIPLSPAQRTIAKRMTSSRTTIPDFTLTFDVDFTAALAMRHELNAAASANVSINDVIVKAVALTLREFPRLNASFEGDAIVEHETIDIGVAVATEDSLLVPVVRRADRMALQEIARETRLAAERARSRRLGPDELEGATFTISNLGNFGVSSFQAVIAQPQVAILAVGRVERRPVFDASGALVARDVAQLSLSCDHRVVYGAEAARFLQRLNEILSQPVMLTGSATPSDRGDHE